MNHLRTRNDIMTWLENNAPYLAIRRAMHKGKTELLGAFKRIPPTNTMGWIVKVTSGYAKIWYIAIQPDDLKRTFKCHVTASPHWENWMGCADPLLPIVTHMGDNPKLYEELKNETKERRLNQTR